MTQDPNIPDHDVASAGEYVLGTMPHAERQDFRRRADADPALRTEIAKWEARLDPLSGAFDPVTPPAAVWTAIERRLFASPVAAAAGVSRLWRGLALVSTLAAAVLAALVWLRTVPVSLPEGGPLWVSDMVSQNGEIRLAALYDEASGEMRVSLAGAPPREGRDYELWLIQGDRAPISLGVMPRDGQAAMPVPAVLRALVANATMAITDEPSGGSPGGVATGPVLAAAPMRRI